MEAPVASVGAGLSFGREGWGPPGTDQGIRRSGGRIDLKAGERV